ncbi:MAG: MASE3 domain-containing protein, partial [Thermodesulfobacteriota bacterium]
MEDGFNEKNKFVRTLNYIICFLLLAGLYLVSLYNFLLFHSLAEIFSIVVSCAVFLVAWNARRFIDNNYLLLVGISLLFVGGIDALHTLAFKGMGVFPGQGANQATQLWIAARFLQAFSLLAAPFLFGRKLRFGWICAGYAAVTAILVASVFYWKNFPACFEEGVGLTGFKKTSEYLISGILLASGGMLLARRDKFEKDVLQLLTLSIALMIAAELAFTLYISVYGLSNLVGHFFKILSFLLVYRAVVETGFSKPYGLVFRDLKKNEEALLRSKEELEL